MAFCLERDLSKYVRDQTNFKSQRRHNIVPLSKTRMPRLSTSTNRSRHDMAEKLLTLTESIKFDMYSTRTEKHAKSNMFPYTNPLPHRDAF